ncbi:hypothetical protein V6N12_049979 [Hibiscus sabdariffa]|uniref:Uncharacterized protein n=1 Tax=Hibiscus sabdariffa TaxID=183260 RepID=A0ABR2GC94_9ROSI
MKVTPYRWFKAATVIPGKTVVDVIKHYRELEEDEVGLIPFPGLGQSSYSSGIRWVSTLLRSGWKKRDCDSTFRSRKEERGSMDRRREHVISCLLLFVTRLSGHVGPTTFVVHSSLKCSVASHAQKYFIRQFTGGKGKRQFSIHNITTANIPDTPSSSPDHCKPLSSNNSSAVPGIKPNMLNQNKVIGNDTA